MIALLTLTLLVKSVLASPVTPRVLENDDVKVMKCVAEALADVLSRPRPLPVSQQCLQTLRTDERLLTLLRRYDFLKELQDVATQAVSHPSLHERERACPPSLSVRSVSHPLPRQDGSMLNALGGPGERSVLSQERRRSREQEEDEGEEGGEVGRIWTAGEKREEDGERAEEDQKAWGPEEIRRNGSKEEKDKRSEEEEEEEEEEGMKKRSKGSSLRKKSENEEEEEGSHHSKEVSEEKEEVKKRNRSPEEKELQMIARRTPGEEDGSAGRKAEDGEVENLAAIKSELENVAQKLQQLRRG
ncbi:chromogranin-A isoform X1 [Phycodurus eques]|uniref:chromogranin-A isoform X1 n=1 Tax=Phycodurus eques TaxID=693459 RepID=UPI002ACED662|nr:chromogranin-A isoform X1 [Phycodurus eques]